MTTPHKCPVCDGRTELWIPEQYGSTGTAIYAIGSHFVPCKACKGTGIVWERIGTETKEGHP